MRAVLTKAENQFRYDHQSQNDENNDLELLKPAIVSHLLMKTNRLFQFLK